MPLVVAVPQSSRGRLVALAVWMLVDEMASLVATQGLVAMAGMSWAMVMT